MERLWLNVVQLYQQLILQIRSEVVMRLLFIVVLFCASIIAGAQNKFTLNGYIRDSANGESVIGATVSVSDKSITSNQYGFYSITLQEGEFDILVSHVSYLAQAFHVSLRNNIQQNIF